MKICVLLGTRPEIIKMSPIIRECQERHLDFFILHTNQHYSANLDQIFFDELDLPQPKYNLKAGSGTHAEETGKMMMGIEKVLIDEMPDIVLVEGDTNTVLAGSLAAVKLHMKIGHVEAGLRSYSRQMPEEINRIIADNCSEFLFAPTEKAKKILLGEGIPEDKIFVTGNTVVDAVYQNLKIADNKSNVLDEFNLEPQKFFLITSHRAENVDNEERLRGILKGLTFVCDEFQLPVMFPIHPRTQKMIEKFQLAVSEGIRMIKPVGYIDFLKMQANARLVLTDSGGVQEETCTLKVPCVTLRDNTERPETLDVGSNVLAGTNQDEILANARLMLSRARDWLNPFGDGNAGKRILDIILN